MSPETKYPTSLPFENREWNQLPLDFGFPSANRVAAILSLSHSEAIRLQKLLLGWSTRYGSINIRVTDDMIIIPGSQLALSDITPTSRDAVSLNTPKTPTFGKFLYNSPNENLISTKTWISLYNEIPGIGLEKVQNFLKLLGHEHGPFNCLYWTDETMVEENYEYYHWLLHIHLMPQDRSRRVKRGVLHEKDMSLYDFGDNYVFFAYAPIGTLAYQREAKNTDKKL